MNTIYDLSHKINLLHTRRKRKKEEKEKSYTIAIRRIINF